MATMGARSLPQCVIHFAVKTRPRPERPGIVPEGRSALGEGNGPSGPRVTPAAEVGSVVGKKIAAQGADGHPASGEGRAGAPQDSTTWAISAAPIRAQFCAVSLIRSRFTGVWRSITEPQTLQGMLLFLTSTVTSFSVCCPQPEQRIRRIVRSAAENAIEHPPVGRLSPRDQARWAKLRNG